jgi:carbon monoxide dehydrogenase subunit G
MSTIQHSTDVNAPVRQVYNQWTQFEEFPRFMEGVESVRQLDDTHLHWIATVGGKRKEWDAVITEQSPDQRVAWTSTTGAPNAGMAEFMRISDMSTRVTLTIDVQPEGGVEKVGDALGIPSGQVKGDLERFKKFIEERGSATGAWRGEVEGGRAAPGTKGTAGASMTSSASSSLGSASSAAITSDPESGRMASGYGSSRSSRVDRGSMTDSELAGNVAGTGAARTTGGGFAEGQASEAGERELAGAGSSMGMAGSHDFDRSSSMEAGNATPDDPYGTGTGAGMESSTDNDRSIGQPGYGSTTSGSTLEDPLDPRVGRRDIDDA